MSSSTANPKAIARTHAGAGAGAIQATSIPPFITAEARVSDLHRIARSFTATTATTDIAPAATHGHASPHGGTCMPSSTGSAGSIAIAIAEIRANGSTSRAAAMAP